MIWPVAAAVLLGWTVGKALLAAACIALDLRRGRGDDGRWPRVGLLP